VSDGRRPRGSLIHGRPDGRAFRPSSHSRKRALDEALARAWATSTSARRRAGTGRRKEHAGCQPRVVSRAISRPPPGPPGDDTTRVRSVKEGVAPVSIFRSTRRLEKMANYCRLPQALQSVCRERQQERDTNRHIHVCWVCVEEDLRRVEVGRKRPGADDGRGRAGGWSHHQARADRGFRAVVQEFMPGGSQRCPRPCPATRCLTMATCSSPWALRELVRVDHDARGKGQRRAFVAAQKVDTTLQKKATPE